MTRKSFLLDALCVASLWVLPHASSMALELGGVELQVNSYFSTSFQSVEAGGGAFAAANTDTSSGFNRNRFSIGFTITPNDLVSVFVELSEEPGDFGTNFQISNDLSWLDLSLLNAFTATASDRHSLVLRVGTPVVGLFNYRGYSDGAVVQGNPLIGNSPWDLVSAQSGTQLIGTHTFPNGLIESIGWDLGLFVPTFGESFSGDLPYDLVAKARFEIGSSLKIGAGVYRQIGGGDQFRSRQQSEGVQLSNGQTAVDRGSLDLPGWLFGDGEVYNFAASSPGARDTHAHLTPGVDASGWHVDLQFTPALMSGRTLFRAWVGTLNDDYSFVDMDGNQMPGQPSNLVARRDASSFGWGTEATVSLIPDKLYIAGRFVKVSNRSAGVAGTPHLNRVQLGGGLWLHASTLLKFEFVRQSEEINSPGQIGDDWDGVSTEISFQF